MHVLHYSSSSLLDFGGLFVTIDEKPAPYNISFNLYIQEFLIKIFYTFTLRDFFSFLHVNDH